MICLFISRCFVRIDCFEFVCLTSVRGSFQCNTICASNVVIVDSQFDLRCRNYAVEVVLLRLLVFVRIFRWNKWHFKLSFRVGLRFIRFHFISEWIVVKLNDTAWIQCQVWKGRSADVQIRNEIQITCSLCPDSQTGQSQLQTSCNTSARQTPLDLISISFEPRNGLNYRQTIGGQSSKQLKLLTFS